MKIKKFITISFCILLTQSLFSEPKRLVCIQSAEKEAERWQGFGETHKAEICRNAKFGWKNIFDFDTDDLNSEGGKFEITRENCNPEYVTKVQRGSLEATNSVITFTWYITNKYSLNFNVDRKTLRAGKDLDRSFECSIQEIDLSENQI